MRACHRPILVLLLAAATAAAGAASTDAPADKSFGPFKYTAISVRTKIDALARAYRERWESDDSVLHDAEMIQSSYDAWAQRYPHDRWLAPTAFHLAELYAQIQSPRARARAKSAFSFVAKTFPNTKEGHLSRLRLVQGFPPLKAETPVQPTPNPYASEAPAPSASPQRSASPSASAAPVATMQPNASPSPSPKASP